MIKLNTLLVFLSLNAIAVNFIQAQKQVRCGSDELSKELMQQNPAIIENINNAERDYIGFVKHKIASKTSNGTRYVIPIVVHIIYRPEDSILGVASNINDEQVYKQIAILNKAYRGQLLVHTDETDVQVEFKLATLDPNGYCHTGINRIKSSESFMVSIYDTSPSKSIKRFSHWPREKYLNIYVVHSVKGYLGYSTFPWNVGTSKLDSLDGVVIGASFFGPTNDNRYYLGYTAVHEIGHWLGLYHTFQPECSNPPLCTISTLCKNYNCITDGDKVCDTPPVELPNFIPSPCDSIVNSCLTDEFDTSSQNPFRPKAKGGLGDQNDMYKNYMDYADDNCMQLFTIGQINRMNFHLQNARSSIWQHNNVIATGVKGLFHDFDSVRTGFALNGKVKAMVEWPAKNKLIVAGDFTSADGVPVNGLAEWNGTKWDSLVGVPTAMLGQIYAMAVYKNELYVGGTFNYAGICKYLGKTSGSGFSKVTTKVSVDATSNPVNALCVYGQKLYVGGDFGMVDGNTLNANRIASWDIEKLKWDSLRSGLFGNSSACYAMARWNNYLAVGGRFVKAGGIDCDKIALWDGTKWISINSGSNVTSGGRLNCIGSFGSKLFTGGDYSSVGGALVAGLSVYDGQFWGNNSSSTYGINRYAIEPFNGLLWVGGNITDLTAFMSHAFTYDDEKDSVTRIAKEFDGFDASVTCMTQYKGELYIGGEFQNIRGVNGNSNKIAYNICKVKTYCSGKTFIPTISTENHIQHEINLYPNPVKHILTIENAMDNIEIFNTLGQKVMVKLNQDIKIELDLSGLESGLYFLKCKQSVKRFVIE